MLFGHRGQRHPWTHFQQGAGSLHEQGFHTLGKSHRLANVLHIIVNGDRLVIRDQPARYIGDIGNLRRLEPDLRADLAKFFHGRLHQPGVKGMAGHQPPRLNFASLQFGFHGFDVLRRTGKHHEIRTVHCGEIHSLPQHRAQRGFIAAHSQHHTRSAFK